MRSCPSCGGIIGRDCFNPIECAQITASMDSYYAVEDYKKSLDQKQIDAYYKEQQDEYFKYIEAEHEDYVLTQLITSNVLLNRFLKVN